MLNGVVYLDQLLGARLCKSRPAKECSSYTHILLRYVTSHMIALFMNFRMSHFLVCLNSSTNFLIYYLNGEKFRRAWVETYGGWCCCCQTQAKAQTTVIEMPRPVPEIHFEMCCKAPSGRLGSSVPVDTVEAEAIKFHTCGPSARDHKNKHSSFQNSYENTHCVTIQKRGNVTNV